ncbi:monovalent cation/H(+) antiporter subunit G [Rhizobium sp. LjRoot30]|uniref:monovalent cation/H(+) antiporter subunit G n=1 Tax=Rhizobium sp. LjRoot30 TaxID=3342320 RepID=UPI003ECF2BD5
MIADSFALLCAFLLVAGSAFALTAAIGINRFPDLFTRMHAASKAGTVGASLLLLAAGLYSGELAVLLRAIAGIVFLVLTAPVAAHLLARAAQRSGYRISTLSVRGGRQDNKK